MLVPDARGTGAGRRLVETVLAAARAAGYERLHLFTFSDLRAAGSLYRSVGFEVSSSERTAALGPPHGLAALRAGSLACAR